MKKRKDKSSPKQLIEEELESRVFIVGEAGTGKTHMLTSMIAKDLERISKVSYDQIVGTAKNLIEVQKDFVATAQDAPRGILASLLDLIGNLGSIFNILSPLLKVLSNRAKGSPTDKENSEPSRFGEYLLYLFLSKQERENLIGDLVEEYKEVYAKFGGRKAKIWFYKQVYSSIWPLARRIIIKWGLIAWLGEWFRRLIS